MTPIVAAEIVLVGAAGLVVGSFVTTAAQRAARGEAFLGGRSHCDHCGEPLSWVRTTPLLAYAGAHGRARCCGARIDPIHPAGEAAGAVIALVPIMLRPTIEALLLTALGFVLLALAVFDLKVQRLPNLLVVTAAPLSGALAWMSGRLVEGVIAAIASLIVLSVLAWGFRRRAGQGGLGQGDVKLFSSLALWLGALAPFALCLAALAGLAEAAVRGVGRGERLAFGPHIAAAGYAIGLAAPWLEGLFR